MISFLTCQLLSSYFLRLEWPGNGMKTTSISVEVLLNRNVYTNKPHRVNLLSGIFPSFRI